MNRTKYWKKKDREFERRWSAGVYVTPNTVECGACLYDFDMGMPVQVFIPSGPDTGQPVEECTDWLLKLRKHYGDARVVIFCRTGTLIRPEMYLEDYFRLIILSCFPVLKLPKPGKRFVESLAEYGRMSYSFF